MSARLKVWFLGEGESRSAWERVLERDDWREGECLKQDDRGRGVWRAEVLGAEAIVKCRPVPGLAGRLRSRFGATDLTRATLGAALLEARGFETPRVRFTGMYQNGEGWHEVLVTEVAPGEGLLDRWVHAGPQTRRTLASCIGCEIGALCQKGIFNRDAKPSNWLIEGDRTHLVDVGGVRVTGGRRPRELARMIAALGFEPAGVGAPPKASEIMAAVRSALGASGLPTPDKHKAVSHLRELIASHGDPTPKDDPRAQATKMR